VALQHLLFDLDGTLTDPGDGITACLAHALAAMGQSAPPRATLERCIGPPLADSFGWLLERPSRQRVNRAIAAYRQRFERVGYLENRLYPWIPDLLCQLRQQGFTLSVATSKPRTYGQRIVAHFGLASHFVEVFGAELDGRRSDKTSLLQHALRSLATAPVEAVMIGDREHDVRGAHANGLLAIGVTWGYGSPPELEEVGADRIVDSAPALVAALSEWRSAASRPLPESTDSP
jgi:phosphoglycolate phosphatase